MEKYKIKIVVTIVLYSFIFFIVDSAISAVPHPHMIVKESEYEIFRSRSHQWPWSVMKSKAISDAQSLSYNKASSYDPKCYRAQEIASACALAYILDPDNKSLYVNKVETELVNAMSDIRIIKQNSEDEHLYSVPPSSAAFMAYLVLDIMYNDLDSTKRKSIEDDCDYIASFHKDSWRESKYSIEGMKELYHNGLTDIFIQKKDAYKNLILDETTDGGVFSTGPGYSKSRLFMDKRIQKKMFMDICEYQGFHEFYSDSKIIALQEWVMGYLVTPFNRSYTFGDSPPTKDLDHWAASVFRVSRFSKKAQKYAAWNIGRLTDGMIKGRLLHCILCDSIPLEPEKPVSRIFNPGGAWLLDESGSDRALAGVLWNIKVNKESHTHKDVNAIHIAAYGEHVIRNSGYDGYGAGDWTWIHDRAESSNTLLLDGMDHNVKQGSGINEGFVGSVLEYACGNSGGAIGLGIHLRNFIFVKPQENSEGYFILIDDITALIPGQENHTANIAIHPNSSQDPIVLSIDQEYQWEIEGCNYSGQQVYVTLFLGTEPSNVSIKTGYKGSYSDCSRFDGKYLYATYELDEDRHGSLVSVIFPHDESHKKANMTQLKLIDASGTAIDHGSNIVDYAIGSPHAGEVMHEGVTFNGLATVYRTINNNVRFFFVRQGTAFDDGSVSRVGFISDSPVTIFMNDKNGQIISPGTTITIFFPEITGVIIDGEETPFLESDGNWVKIHIDEGNHDIQIISNATSISEEQNNVIKSFDLFQNYPNPFNPKTVISYKLVVGGMVELTIYDHLGKKLVDLVSHHQSTGKYSIEWDASNFASGVYYYRLRCNSNYVQTRKLILLR
jgi:hypothetical protein